MITTITIIKYQGLKNKYWAFTMMQRSHQYVQDTKGLTFYKVLGTGAGNGFRPSPDFSEYAFLGVWKEEKHATDFFKDSELFNRYDARSEEIKTVYMHTIRAHGSWDGKQPFIPGNPSPSGKEVGIITRATIAKHHLWRFWRKVPAVSAALNDQPGLIYSKGVGEWPLSQMATFSLWENEESMRAYAYSDSRHLEAIKLTRKLNWYTEEMFARFRPYRYEGAWF